MNKNRPVFQAILTNEELEQFKQVAKSRKTTMSKVLRAWIKTSHKRIEPK